MRDFVNLANDKQLSTIGDSPTAKQNRGRLAPVWWQHMTPQAIVLTSCHADEVPHAAPPPPSARLSQ